MASDAWGANIVRRLQRAGNECVVFDRNPAAVNQLAGEGATGAASLDHFVEKLSRPPAAGLMVPAAVTGQMVEDLTPKLEPGDIIIDGGNSYYLDDIDRARRLQPHGVHYVDCGTSGGVRDLQRGFCLMVGDDRKVVEHLEPISAASPRASTCTAGRTAQATL